MFDLDLIKSNMTVGETLSVKMEAEEDDSVYPAAGELVSAELDEDGDDQGWKFMSCSQCKE